MKKFTILIALALIVSAVSAQNMPRRAFPAGRTLSSQGQVVNTLSTAINETGTVSSTPGSVQSPWMAPSGTSVLTEGFDGTTGVAMPAGWTMVNSATGTITASTLGAWMTTATTPHSGTRTAYINLANTTAVGYWGQLRSPALTLTAGKNYQISIWIYWGAGASTTYLDALTVYLLKGAFDTTNDPIIATVMDAGPFSGQTPMPQQIWTQYVVNVTPDETGSDYYLYFEAGNINAYTTPNATYKGGNLRVDDVSVQELTLKQNDLAITASAYPFSQVPATQTILPTLSADVKNWGSAPQTNVKVTVSHNGTVIGTSAPLASLDPLQTSTFTITSSDPVVVGDNTLTYTVSADLPDDDTSDNSFTTTFTGTTHLFATDDGSMATYISGTANYRYGSVYTFTQPTVLNQVQAYLYTGHNTTTNGYTLRIQAITGPNTADATIIYSQPFTAVASTAWTNVSLTTPQTLAAGSYFISIGVTTATNYLLADAGIQGRTPYASTNGTALSYGTGSAFLRLLVDLSANDIQIVPTSTGFPYAQVPLIIGQSLPFPNLPANVYNMGSAPQTNIVFSATYNGADMGSSTLASLASLTTTTMSITPPAGTLFPTTVGTSDLVYTVAQTETDNNPADNTLTCHFQMSDNVYAVDNVPATNIVGAGYGTANSRIGNIFTIPNTVLLTQVQIGFDNNAAAANERLVITRATNTTTINATDLFATVVNFTRPAGGGWITVNVPTTMLTPGMYFLAVQSLTADNHMVGCDPLLNNTIYLAASATATTLSAQTGTFGAGAIRMVLQALPANDASVTAITSPVSGKNLSTAETVTATITNLGSQPITSCDLELTVDGTVVATETYTGSGIATNATDNYTFTAKADLSQEGDHTIKVRAILTGDANNDNDSYTVTVNNLVCIATFPFSEDFGSNTYNCWTWSSNNTANTPGVATVSGNVLWRFTSSANATGTNAFYQYLFTPVLPESTYPLKVTFDIARSSTTAEAAVAVGYSTTDNAPTSFTWQTPTFTPTTTTLTTNSITVPAGAKYIAFNYQATARHSGSYYYIDNIHIDQLYDDDAAVTAITSPVSGPNLTAAETVIATVKNNGQNDITALDMELTVDGIVVATEPYTGTIAAGATYNYTFTATADLSAPGDHFVKVKAILTGDENADNDSLVVTVTNVMYTVNLLTSDDNLGTTLGSGVYPPSTNITIYAIPKMGNYFAKWSDNNTDNPRALTVTGDITLTATLGDNAAMLAQIAELEADTTNMGNQIRTLNGQITTLNNQITTLNNQITTLQSDNAALTTQVNELKTDTTNMGILIRSLQSQIADLNSQITILNGQITTLNGQITTLQADNTALTNQVTDLQNQITTLNGQITTLQADNADLTNQIIVLNGQITDLQNQLDVANDTIASLRQQLADCQAVSVPTVTASSINVYPNPVHSNGLLYIDGDNLKAGDKLEIYSMAGKLVSTHYATGINNYFNIGNLADGMYMLRCAGRNGIKFEVR